MAININQFRELASLGGKIQVDHNTGDLVTRGRSFKGKIAYWIRSKTKSGTVAAENRAAMNSFIRAIASDPNYGPGFANMASRELTPLAERGRPLSARKVMSLMGSFDRSISILKANNKYMAIRFSEYDVHGDPFCFGSVLARVAAEKGFRVTDGMDLSGLKKAISMAIVEAGDGGRHGVSPAEAKEITARKIDQFITNRKELLSHIEGMDVSDKEKEVLRDMVVGNGKIKTAMYLDSLVQAREGGSNVIARLLETECSRLDMMKAFHEFESTFDAAWSMTATRESGMDDIYRLAGDIFDFVIKSEDLGREELTTLKELLSSRSAAEMTEALGFLSYNMSEILDGHGGLKGQEAELVGKLARIGPFYSVLSGIVQENLDPGQEMQPPAYQVVVEKITDIPDDIGDFAKELGVPLRGSREIIVQGLEEEIENARTDHSVLFRGNTDVTRAMASHIKANGKEYLSRVKDDLVATLDSGKTGVELYRDFLNRYLGGNSEDDGREAARQVPEGIRTMAKVIYDQVAGELDETAAKSGVAGYLFLRGVTPVIVNHCAAIDDSAMKSAGLGIASALQALANGSSTRPDYQQVITEYGDAFRGFMEELVQ